MLRESLRMSLQNIIGNKMRSFLTVLGIVIGVLAIITMVGVLQNATDEVTGQFEALGTGVLTVQAQGTALKSGLTEADLQTIAAMDEISGISPTVTSTLYAVAGSKVQKDVSLEGVGTAYFSRQTETVQKGRPLLPLDEEGKLYTCVIDTNLAEALFSGSDPIGQRVLIGGSRFTVVGILDEAGQSDVMSQLSGGKDDGRILVPYTTAMRLLGLKTVSSLRVYVRDSAKSAEAAQALEAELERMFNYKDNSYQVINMESLMDVMNTMMGMMTGLLTGIASIALLVGGIGIMNMMLVSVTERTNEIGLRKALGAKPRSIQIQFLFESVMLSLLGGLVGVILGVAASWLICSLMSIPFAISMSAIALGVGFSLAVGVVFGWAPARKASNLNPIDALRSN